MVLSDPTINECGCELCRMEVACKERELHEHINLLMSRLDEQQRRWFAGYLAMQYGSIAFVATVTGMSEKTIRRGMGELGDDLMDLSMGRIRTSGGGRRRSDSNKNGF